MAPLLAASHRGPDESTQRAIAATLATLPAYQPRPVEFPEGASYVTPDGAIMIYGYDETAGHFEAINKLFVAAHPGFKFLMKLRKTASAPAALASGASAVAPMGAEFDDLDFAAYRKLLHSIPLMLRVAHDSINPEARSSPLGIFVHRDNPLTRLTVTQVARIFTTGSGRGDIRKWGDTGLDGEWTTAEIHPVVIPPDVALGLFMQRKWAGRPYAANVVQVRDSPQIVKAVSQDKYSIGFASASLTDPNTKLIAIDAEDGSKPSMASAEDIMAGTYAYDRHLLIYLAQPVEPWIREYMRLFLSREGQTAIAAESRGYLPLNAREVAEELAKLYR